MSFAITDFLKFWQLSQKNWFILTILTHVLQYIVTSLDTLNLLLVRHTLYSAFYKYYKYIIFDITTNFSSLFYLSLLAREFLHTTVFKNQRRPWYFANVYLWFLKAFSRYQLKSFNYLCRKLHFRCLAGVLNMSLIKANYFKEKMEYNCENLKESLPFLLWNFRQLSIIYYLY